jgi:hypothetical protein
MSSDRIIRHLLTAAGQPAERRKARIAWVKKTADAWGEAQRLMDERCTEAVERLDPEAFARLLESEQAKVDAIHAQLQAVINKDQWPRELYFGCI